MSKRIKKRKCRSMTFRRIRTGKKRTVKQQEIIQEKDYRFIYRKKYYFNYLLFPLLIVLIFVVSANKTSSGFLTSMKLLALSAMGFSIYMNYLNRVRKDKVNNLINFELAATITTFISYFGLACSAILIACIIIFA